MHPPLSDRELLNRRAKKPKGKTAYVIDPGTGEAMPALTWQTQPDGIQYLSARFSLPRQRWGHNARLPKSQVDIFAGLGAAADAIYDATGLIFNPLTANVTEVHYARDFCVGTERVRAILDRLEHRKLPRYTRIRFDNGVEFKQRQAATQVYGKLIEVLVQIEKGHIPPALHSDAIQAAEGVLRVEHKQRLPAVDRSQKRRGLSRAASAVLTPDASHHVIAGVLDKLEFADAVNNAEIDPVLQRLIDIHGATTAQRLIGFLRLVKFYGPDFWRILDDYARRTYYNNLRLCKAAGVWDLGE